MSSNFLSLNPSKTYDAAAGVVYGKVYQAGRSTLVGNPPAQVAGELDRLWTQQFRQKP